MAGSTTSVLGLLQGAISPCKSLQKRLPELVTPHDTSGGPWTSHGILPVLDGLLGDIEDDYYKLPHMFLLTCGGLVQTPSLKLGMTPVALPLRYILLVFDHCLLFEAPLDMITPTYRPYTWYTDHLSPSGTSTKYRPTWV